MQNTADLWSLMCADLDSRRQQVSASEQIEAAKRFEAAAREVFKEHPTRYRDALEIAGDIHQAAGETTEAWRCFEGALELAQGRAAHAERARIATKLAVLADAGEDATNAEKFYGIAVDAHSLGHDRSELPTLLNNLAGLQRARGDFKAAVRSYRRALSEAAHVHGADHPEVALIANNLGVAYTDHADLAKAEDQHLRALQIRESAFGSVHPDVGQSMANLAVVYHARGLHAKAERFYRSALEILRHFVAPDDPQMVRITTNYERLPQVLARKLSRTMRL